MRSSVLATVALAATLAGCKKEAPVPQPGAGPSASASATAAEPSVPAGQARKVAESNERYEFEYAYPAAADAIPKLKALLDGDLARQRAELAGEAKGGMADAKSGGFEYRPYSRYLDWQVVTDLPGWLSLSTTVSSDTGGAHPNYVFDALLWDKTVGERRSALDLFISRKALAAAIGKDFCDAIDRQRTKKRGEPIERESGDMFTNCLDPTDYTVILGSAGHRGFDRIGVLVPPYEAGPYAEGSYEVTLPITAKLLALVKPEYRSSFDRVQ